MEQPKPDESWLCQSGVIPFKVKDGKIFVLMITSRRKKRWIFPKGIIEPSYSATESAAKEAEEEAGVKGRVYPEAIGTYTNYKWGGKCSVVVYPMKVKEELKKWDEAYLRTRKWMKIDEAKSATDNKEIAVLIEKLPDFINKFK